MLRAGAGQLKVSRLDRGRDRGRTRPRAWPCACRRLLEGRRRRVSGCARLGESGAEEERTVLDRLGDGHRVRECESKRCEMKRRCRSCEQEEKEGGGVRTCAQREVEKLQTYRKLAARESRRSRGRRESERGGATAASPIRSPSEMSKSSWLVAQRFCRLSRSRTAIRSSRAPACQLPCA